MIIYKQVLLESGVDICLSRHDERYGRLPTHWAAERCFADVRTETSAFKDTTAL